MHDTPFLPTYRRLPITVDRAFGMSVVSTDGIEYLDFLGGIGVNVLGHSDPAVIAAITEQVGRYAHLSNFFDQPAQRAFMRRLLSFGPYSAGSLCNSGTEATDGALKLARLVGHETGRTEIVSFSGAFHGRGFGALSTSDKPKYTDGIGPFLPGFRSLPFDAPEILANHLSAQTAAVIIEFVQGEGGVRPFSPSFVDELSRLKEEHGFLVIADEVQAGCGRTGNFFSFDFSRITPDIVLLAKGIGGGLPLGAFIVTPSLASGFLPGQHGTTFGGNAVSCAAGSIVLDRLAGGLTDHVREIGDYMLDRFQSLQKAYPSLIHEIRGSGCMIGLDLSFPATDVVNTLLTEHHIIANATSETVLRLLPPYIVEKWQIDTLVEALNKILSSRC